VGSGLARVFAGDYIGPAPDASVFEPAIRLLADVAEERADAAESSDRVEFAGVEFAAAGPEVWTVSRTLPRFGLAAVRSADHKLVVEIGPEGCAAGAQSWFDLKADPGERKPLPPEGRPEASAMLAAFSETETWPCAADPGEAESVDPVTRARLRALGYAD
jgi:hypothetical protein